MAKKKTPLKAARAETVKQSDFPSFPLSQALRIAKGLSDDFAGKNAPPHEIALAIGLAPTSSSWRMLCGASIAYGLTDGGYNADVIALTPLGKRVVAPEVEGDDEAAKVEAFLKPRLAKEFFSKYDRAKFPQDVIAANVLVGLGLPRDRASEAVEMLKNEGKTLGIVRDTKTGLFVALSPSNRASAENGNAETKDQEVGSPEDVLAEPQPHKPLAIAAPANANGKVFITHGKSKAIVAQLKELLVFGKLEPVVSVERESTAVPVPDKVFDDMRMCSAGVIHVGNEGEMLDQEGKKHIHINHNVLIEIGAAIALYKKRVILLVEKGVALPSNLQGLYRCEYEGDRLDYEATMKLLKTFNEFR